MQFILENVRSMYCRQKGERGILHRTGTMVKSHRLDQWNRHAPKAKEVAPHLRVAGVQLVHRG